MPAPISAKTPLPTTKTIPTAIAKVAMRELSTQRSGF